jgi:aldehyde dehydrogenase (NAD+)
MADKLEARASDYSAMWPRESGVLYAIATAGEPGNPETLRFYADLADDYPFEEPFSPSTTSMAGGGFGLLVREPVGVVGAIIPWNAPLPLILIKVAPALLAGCTVIVKVSPEAPGAGYLMVEIAEEVGLPGGVLNVITADREVSELMVRDHRVDKIAFTGSTAAGRKIGAICGERVARCTLELGGKSAAVILDDADMNAAAMTLAGAECFLSGQVCASLTRIVVPRQRHDEFADALAAAFSAVQVGDPFDAATQMGPLAMERQRDRVEHYIAKGIEEGATLVTGGGRPKHLKRGYYIEPSVRGGGQQACDRARGDLRAGAQRDSGRQRRACGRYRQRHHLRAQRGGLHARMRAGRGRSPDDCARAPLGTTECGSILTSRSVGSSSLAWAGRVAGKDSCLTWRARRCCWTGRRPSRSSNL